MVKISSVPKISVLIPVYKVEKYVKRCILSVLNQTMQEGVEVIIVNDCTPDDSMRIIQEVLDRCQENGRMAVRVIEHERNRGLAATRNTLINHAKGEYILHIDSDDYVDTDILEKMYNRATETEADIVMVDVLKEYLVKKRLRKAPYYTDKNKILAAIIRGKNSYVWNKLVRRSLYVENQINWREGMDMSEDYGVTVPLCYAANKIEYVPGVFYHYVQYNMSAITKCNVTQKEIDGSLYAIERLDNLVKEKGITGFELDIAYSKLNVKLKCMKNTRKESPRKYVALYPEVAPYKWNLLRMYPNMYCKLLLRMFLANLFYLFSLLKKRFA